MEALHIRYWEAAQPALRKHFTDVVYDTWIKQLVPLRIDGDIFVLKTHADFFKPTVEHRYVPEMTAVLREVTAKSFTIKILSPDDLLAASSGRPALRDILRQSNLRSRYVFETFVRGKCNELAYAAAVAVAEAPGHTSFNPLFLYGGVGLGKTHLMHSIGNYIIEANRNTKLLYVSSETFTNELIYAIRERQNEQFRNKYRDIDVLLIDDIQFISEKEGTQEEFFHTFNTLYNANKQIVISSDQPPKGLATLEDRLRSRFGCGLIVDVSPPDFETRAAIVDKKCEIDQMDIPANIKTYIAKNVVSNIRDLEGALNRVAAYAKLSNADITMELAEKAVDDVVAGKPYRELSVDVILEAVADYYNISCDEIKSKRRTQKIAHPRQIAMYLSRKMLNLSLPDIGKEFSRDHSTISHGCDKIAYDIETDPKVRTAVIVLEDRLKGEAV